MALAYDNEPQHKDYDLWWNAVQYDVKRFANLIDRSPTAHMGDIQQYADLAKMIYVGIEQNTCPNPMLQATLKQMTLNLAMAYEAITEDDWVASDVFYGRACSQWVIVQVEFATLGLRKS